MYKFSTNHKYQEKEMSDMGDEMKGYFVGPMSAAEFLDMFFPKKLIVNTRKAKQFTKGIFNKVISCELKKQAYCPFVGLFLMPMCYCYWHGSMTQVDIIKSFAPTLEIVNLSTHTNSSGPSKFSFNIKPDVCVYTEKSRHWGLTDVAHAEVIIEFK